MVLITLPSHRRSGTQNEPEPRRDSTGQSESYPDSGSQDPKLVEWTVAIVIALGAALFVMSRSRDLWFFSDLWDYLGARDMSFESLMRQHGGHWNLWTVLAVQALAWLRGMDFFPWYVAPMSAVYAFYSVLVWRILAWRGVTVPVRLAFVTIIGLLAASAWQQNVAYIGGIIIQVVALAIATALERWPDKIGSRVGVASLLLVAVSTSGSGLAVLAAFLVVSVVKRKPRWLILAAPAIVVYGWWWLNFGSSTPSSMVPQLDLAVFLRLPRIGLEILNGGMAAFLTVSGAVAVVSLLAVIGVVIWRWVHDGVDTFDLMMTLSLLAFVGLIAVVRVGSGGFSATSTQYASGVIAFALPIVVPKFRIPRSAHLALPLRGLIVIGTVTFVAINASNLSAGLASRSVIQQQHRLVDIAAAKLVDQGEPFLPFAQISPQLSGRTVQRLSTIYPGWFDESSTPEATQEGRGKLRTSINASGSISGMPLTVSDATTLNGCARTKPGQALQTIVNGPGRVEIMISPPGRVSIEWQDEYGSGIRRATIRRENSILSYSGPPGSTMIIRSLSGSAIQLCGAVDAISSP